MIQNIESNQKIISKENSNKCLNKNNYIYFERLEKRAKNKLIKSINATNRKIFTNNKDINKTHIKSSSIQLFNTVVKNNK